MSGPAFIPCSDCRGEGTVTYEDDFDDRPWGGYSVCMVTATCMTCEGSGTALACGECGEATEDCCCETKTAPDALTPGAAEANNELQTVRG